MSRYIKFRAWDKESRRWVPEEDFYLPFDPTDCNFAKACLFIYDDFNLPGDHTEVVDMDDYVVEQYTGLKDKNGKEIYEGDIVKCYSTADEPCLAVVRYGLMPDICGHEYCPCKIGFYLDDKMHFDEDFGEDDDHGDLEVIGNIHENSELMKGEKGE